jgi:photosystem II stability/assembly factor-like uncharacterized protein
MNKILVLLSAVVLFSSCGKDENPIPNIPVLPDTLGTGWTKTQVSTTIADIVFKDNLVGYFATTNKVYKSVDGGITWAVSNSDPRSFLNLFVTSDGKLFGVDYSYSVFRSVDGGITFLGHLLDHELSDVFFLNNSIGYVSSSQHLFKTIDGGDSWQEGDVFPAVMPQLAIPYFLDENTGWVGNSTGVLRTTGTATPWAWATINTLSPVFINVFAVSPTIVYAFESNGRFHKSTDGGSTFGLIYDSDDIGYPDIHFFDSNTGYISLGGRIYKTTDGGNTWQKVVALGNSAINEICFTDQNHGWACSTNGDVLRFVQ